MNGHASKMIEQQIVQVHADLKLDKRKSMHRRRLKNATNPTIVSCHLNKHPQQIPI